MFLFKHSEVYPSPPQQSPWSVCATLLSCLPALSSAADSQHFKAPVFCCSTALTCRNRSHAFGFISKPTKPTSDWLPKRTVASLSGATQALVLGIVASRQNCDNQQWSIKVSGLAPVLSYDGAFDINFINKKECTEDWLSNQIIKMNQ